MFAACRLLSFQTSVFLSISLSLNVSVRSLSLSLRVSLASLPDFSPTVCLAIDLGVYHNSFFPPTGGPCTPNTYGFQYTVKNEDTYFVAWSNTYYSQSLSFNYDMNVTRTEYALDHARESCRVPCTMDESFGTGSTIIAATDTSAEYNLPHDVDYSYPTRATGYFIAFGLPLFIVLGLVLLCKCVRRRRAGQRDVAASPLLVNAPSHSGSDTVPSVPPPAYGYSDAPPPYGATAMAAATAPPAFKTG